MNTKIPKYFFAIFATIIGVIAGLYLGPDAKPLGSLAKWIIELIKWLAIPIVFVSILDTFIKTEFQFRGFVFLILVASFNAVCAVTIALFLVNIFKMGEGFDFIEQELISNFSTKEFLLRFSSIEHLDFSSLLYNPISIAILSGFFGGAILVSIGWIFPKSQLKHICSQKVEEIWGLLFRLMGYLTYLIPLAIFAGVAKAVGQNGLSVFASLINYSLVLILGLVLQITIVYQSWVRWGLKTSIKKFWSEVKEPTVYAFGVNSSLATLPLTLQALERLGVSKTSSRLSACVGTNFNNDGILLYEVIVALSLCQAFHMDLNLSSQLAVASLCLLASLGSAGLPEAGLMTLTIMISILGLPSEMLPLLISVDWLIGRFRSLTNVLGDMSVAIGIDVLSRRSN